MSPPNEPTQGADGAASPAIALEPIAEERAGVLRNLYELYAYDFSQYVRLRLGPEGRFDVPIGAEWWSRDDHHPFFIRRDGELCGFALVRRGSQVTGALEPMDVAEFFVLRARRRARVGTAAAHAVFAAFPGPWEVRVQLANDPALAFWAQALETFAARPVIRSTFAAKGVEWRLFRVDLAPSRP
jgi:predicted acetyltransferase